MEQHKCNLRLRGFHWSKDYLEADSPAQGRLTFLTLELAPRCFARCLYCFSAPELNKEVEQSLTLQEYKDIILKGKELGARTVVFPGVGEPSLDQKLKPIIEFVHDLGLVSVVYTCGVLDSKTTKFFKSHDVSLIIKVDSLNKSNYERIIGVPYEKFRKSLGQIIRSYEGTLSKVNGCILTRLAANTVVTNINKYDIRYVSDYCRTHQILHFVESLSKVGAAHYNWEQLVGNNAAELATIASQCGHWVSSSTPDEKCGLLSYGITIDVNGDLIGCPTARWIRLGNIKNRSLADLIRTHRSEVHSSRRHYCLARELSLSGKLSTGGRF